jgi:hypothetical protein
MTESVRTWLILSQDRLGKPGSVISRFKGKPARWGWLVIAIAMTVPDRSLNTS